MSPDSPNGEDRFKPRPESQNAPTQDKSGPESSASTPSASNPPTSPGLGGAYPPQGRPYQSAPQQHGPVPPQGPVRPVPRVNAQPPYQPPVGPHGNTPAGQAPYGPGYPQYGQSPYGQPQPPYGQAANAWQQGPKQGKKQTGLIVGALILALALIAGLIFGLVKLLGKDAPAGGTQTTAPSDPSTDPSTDPSASKSPAISGNADGIEFEAGTITVGSDIPAGLYYLEADDRMNDGRLEVTAANDGYGIYLSFQKSAFLEVRDGDIMTLDYAHGMSLDLMPELDTTELQGGYRVGEDIEPGTYVLEPDGFRGNIRVSSDATWSYDSRVGDYNSYDGVAFADLEEGDYVIFNGGFAKPVPNDYKVELTTSGNYRVGKGLDIEPGVYRVTAENPSRSVFSSVYESLRTEDRVSKMTETQHYFEVSEGQVLGIDNAVVVPATEKNSVDLTKFSGELQVGTDLAPGTYLVESHAVSDENSLRISSRPNGDQEYRSARFVEPVYIQAIEGEYITFNDEKVNIIPEADGEKLPTPAMGMVKVGKDLPAGTYTVTPTEDYGGVKIYEKPSYSDRDLLSDEFLSQGETEEITVKDGQYVLLDRMSMEAKK